MIGKYNKKSVPLGPRLMKLPNNECVLKGPYPGVKNVSKAIRKKDYNACARLNGLATDYIYQKGERIYD